MTNNASNLSDEHHCRCFKINPEDISSFRQKLIDMRFEQQIMEEDHGQIFGLRFRMLELLQIHIKVMQDGTIESEMEPPPEYPLAHINPVHSYPPHDALPTLLEHAGVEYSTITPVPETCNLPKKINPDKPLRWWEVVVVIVAFVGLGYLIDKALKN